MNLKTLIPIPARRRQAFSLVELLAALARPQGTLIEVMLEPELISTRGSLNTITQAALKR